MRYLILSDIHANQDAFQTVLRHVRRKRFDTVVLLGDLVGYGAAPNQVLDTVRHMKGDVRCIRGNHDKVPEVFYGNFTLPTAGEAGGVPSGTEKYYSFDRANAHFVVLDSYGSSRAVGGPMWSWLADDLAGNDRHWLVALWHHQVYNAGLEG